MNPNATFDRDLARWLEAEAPTSGPAGLNEAIIERAATLRQRPGWLAALRDTTLPSPALVIGPLEMPTGRLAYALVVLGLVLALVVGAVAAGAFRSQPRPFKPQGSWIATGPMSEGRAQHTATLLPDGRVLVVGSSSAELYDPANGSWAATGSMVEVRPGHTATLLLDGRVLVTGGRGAEVYDPASGTWTATRPMIEAAAERTATLLADGRVLVAANVSTGATASAELFDPSTGSWIPTDPMLVAHIEATATLLSDGRVLVAGGFTNNTVLAAAELYDPASGTWTSTGSMVKARASHTAARLLDDRVLVAGGTNTSMYATAFAELYDPAIGSWTATGDLVMPAARGRTSTVLPDGRVLLVGGLITARLMLGASPELFDPASGSWTVTADMLVPSSFGHTATLLPDGRVLVAGGVSGVGGTSLASSALYDPGSEAR